MFVKNRLSVFRKPVLFWEKILTKTNRTFIMCIYTKRGRKKKEYEFKKNVKNRQKKEYAFKSKKRLERGWKLQVL